MNYHALLKSSISLSPVPVDPPNPPPGLKLQQPYPDRASGGSYDCNPDRMKRFSWSNPTTASTMAEDVDTGIPMMENRCMPNTEGILYEKCANPYVFKYEQ